MVLCELSFPKRDGKNIEELYYHTYPTNAVHLSDEQIKIDASATVCFDTYFNILSHGAYRVYTKLQTIDVRLDIQGDFLLRVRFAGCDRTQREDLILAEELMHCRGLQTRTCTFSLLEDADEGFYYIELTALTDLFLSRGAFCAPDRCQTQVSRLAIVICTYRRETYLQRNVERILQYFSAPERQAFWERIDLLIVDNGRTIDPNIFDNSHITVLPNENTGGSGGFGRGMREIRDGNRGYTHFCLMDDDIVLDPCVLLRTLAFLDLCAKDFPELSIGGAMLSLDEPWVQYEMGGRFTGYKCISQKSGLDLRLRKSLLINEHPESPDFNAWWYMCMPCVYIEKYGLPFPFFIKGDDIDYGFRTGSNILVMNGVGVWHEDFAGKDFGLSEYYIKRNELILCALHCKRPSLLRNYTKLLRAVGKQLLMRRYAVVDLLFRAYEDFLAGADAFLAIDQAVLHKELLAEMPPLVPCAQVPDRPDLRRVEVTRCSLADFCYCGYIFQYSERMQMGYLSKWSGYVWGKAALRILTVLVRMLLHYHVANQNYYAYNAKFANAFCTAKKHLENK